MTAATFDRLGAMAHSAAYRCARDSVDNNVSHFPRGIQHKFDGVFVLFGSQSGHMWERAVCHYDKARPNDLFILEYFVAGTLSFIAYTRFLNYLEERWAYIEQLYGIRFGTITPDLL